MTLSAAPRTAAAYSTVVERGSVPHRIWQGSGLAVVALAVVLFPVISGDFRVTQLGQAVAYAVALLGLNVVTGMSRQISLGHGAMFGIGAYSTAILVSDHGWPFFTALLMSALIGIVVGVVIGLPALRLKGLYLAIVTIAVGTAFPLLLLQPFARDLGSGGSSGKPMFLPWSKPSWFGFDVTPIGFKFVLVCGVAIVVFAGTALLVRSRVGRALFAVRDNETAAAVAGIHVASVKVGSFAFSTMLAAVGGSLFLLMVPIVSPDSIGFHLSLLFITAMIIGGEERVAGAVVGGLVMVFLPTYTFELATQVPVLADLPHPGLLATIVYGVILVACVFFLPKGVTPLLTSVRQRFIRFVPRGLPDMPAAGAEARAEPTQDGQPRTRSSSAHLDRGDHDHIEIS